MFKLLRYYSIASLVAVLLAATLLTWYYRQVAVQGIVELAEHSNLVLTRAALNAVRPQLVSFLEQSSDFQRVGTLPPTLPPEVVGIIRILMQDRHIVRIKIYNRHGVIAFSTKPSQTGSNQRDNPGFVSAMNGHVASTLIYRDTFNSYDGATEEDNLMQTYVPIRTSPADPIHGVFELYADINRLALQTEHTEFIVMTGAILIMTALYASLVLIVQRAGRIIGLQQRTIRERTETLELLSTQMLKNEESHKQRIATELHEGLAQTLAALKLKVENGAHLRDDNSAADSQQSIIPALQDAIQAVRTIAMDLRPPSLDDLGLLPTLDWLCREFQQQHADLRVERHIRLDERDIPSSLKIIIYRIVASVFADMAQQEDTERIQLALWGDKHTLVLLIADTAAEAAEETAIPLVGIDPSRPRFARMEELTTLSGGQFRASRHAAGGTVLRARWSV